MSSTVSGIYLHLEANTAQLDLLQHIRELAFNDESGKLRYMDCSGNLYYFDTSDQVDNKISVYIDTISGVANGLATLDSSGKLVLTQWPDIDFPVDSVNGLSGVVLLTTDTIPQGSGNFYYSNTLARQALIGTTPIVYNNITGEISINVGTSGNSVAAGNHTHGISGIISDVIPQELIYGSNTSGLKQSTELKYNDDLLYIGTSGTNNYQVIIGRSVGIYSNVDNIKQFEASLSQIYNKFNSSGYFKANTTGTFFLSNDGLFGYNLGYTSDIRTHGFDLKEIGATGSYFSADISKVNIPSGNTYDIAGSPHTHTSGTIVGLNPYQVLTGDINGNITQSSNLFYKETSGLFLINKLNSVDAIRFNNSLGSDPTYYKGQLFYDAHNEALVYHTDVSGVTNQLGQETFYGGKVRNRTGSPILNGKVVVRTGLQGNVPLIALASATTASGSRIIGMTTCDIPDDGYGYITSFGIVHDLDTHLLSDNAVLYLSTTSGEVTMTAPDSPNYAVKVGRVNYSHNNQGEIFINIGQAWADVASFNVLRSVTMDIQSGYYTINGIPHTHGSGTISGLTPNLLLSADASGNITQFSNLEYTTSSGLKVANVISQINAGINKQTINISGFSNYVWNGSDWSLTSYLAQAGNQGVLCLADGTGVTHRIAGAPSGDVKNIYTSSAFGAATFYESDISLADKYAFKIHTHTGSGLVGLDPQKIIFGSAASGLQQSNYLKYTDKLISNINLTTVSGINQLGSGEFTVSGFYGLENYDKGIFNVGPGGANYESDIPYQMFFARAGYLGAQDKFLKFNDYELTAQMNHMYDYEFNSITYSLGSEAPQFSGNFSQNDSTYKVPTSHGYNSFNDGSNTYYPAVRTIRSGNSKDYAETGNRVWGINYPLEMYHDMVAIGSRPNSLEVLVANCSFPQFSVWYTENAAEENVGISFPTQMLTAPVYYGSGDTDYLMSYRITMGYENTGFLHGTVGSTFTWLSPDSSKSHNLPVGTIIEAYNSFNDGIWDYNAGYWIGKDGKVGIRRDPTNNLILKSSGTMTFSGVNNNYIFASGSQVYATNFYENNVSLSGKYALKNTVSYSSGLTDPTKFTVSYSHANKQFTVVVSADTTISVSGTLLNISSGTYTTTAHAATSDHYYCYYNNSGVLTVANSVWSIPNSAPLAIAIRNNTDGVSRLMNDRHPGFSGMTDAEHSYHHTYTGSAITSGFSVTGYGSLPAINSNMRYAISAGVAVDEDITYGTDINSGVLVTENKPVLYRSGSDASKEFSRNLGHAYLPEGILVNAADSNKLHYSLLTSGTWSLGTLQGPQEWVCYYDVWMPELKLDGTGYQYTCCSLMGQNVHTSITSAEAESADSYNWGMSPQEWIIFNKRIYKYNNSATLRCELVEVIPIRSNRLTSTGASASSHAILSNRNDNYQHFISSVYATGLYDVPIMGASGLVETPNFRYDYVNNNLLVSGNVKASGIFSKGDLTFVADTDISHIQTSYSGFAQFLLQNTFSGIGASTDLVLCNNLSTDTTYYGDLGINNSAYSGSGSFSLPNATYLVTANGDLVLGSYTANTIRLVSNNSATDSAAITSSGMAVNVKLTLPATTATTAYLNIGSGIAPSSPVNGDIWIGTTAAAALNFRQGSTTLVACDLATAQTVSGAKTFSATVTASKSTDALTISNATGYITGKGYRVGVAAGKTAAYTITTGDELVTGDMTSGAFGFALPSSPGTGHRVTVTKIDSSANILTVSGNGKVIEAASTYPLSRQWQSLTIEYDGTRWIRPDRNITTDLSDVSTTAPTHTQLLMYNSGTATYIPVSGQNINFGYYSGTMFPGNTWYAATTSGTQPWYRIAYGNGRFVTVSSTPVSGIETIQAATSDNGINWTTRTAVNQNWYDLTYGNGLFVAVGYGTANARVMTSPDGISWTERTTTTDSYSNWMSVCYGSGMFVSLGYAGKNQTSPDGINWTTQTLKIPYYNNWNAITYGNGLFVAVGMANPTNFCNVMYSYDGINFSGVVEPNVSGANLVGITFGGGKFVTCASNGAVAYSYNGINWTTASTGAGNLSKICYGEGQFVAVGNNGAIVTSPDGITWTIKTAPASLNYRDICYGDGMFVGVSYSASGNEIVYSGRRRNNSNNSYQYINGTQYFSNSITVGSNTLTSGYNVDISGAMRVIHGALGNWFEGTTSAPLTVYRNVASALAAASVRIGKSYGTVTGAVNALSSGNIIGTVTFGGADGVTQFNNSSSIQSYVDGTVSSGVVPGKLTLRTADATGTLNDAIMINSTQDVSLSGHLYIGVSSTSIFGQVEVNSDASSIAQLALKDTRTNNTDIGPGLSFVGKSTANNPLELSSIKVGRVNASTNNSAYMSFLIRNNSSVSVNPVRIYSSTLQVRDLGALAFGNSGNTFSTYLFGTDVPANISFTLPTGYAAANGYSLTSTTDGIMSWAKPTITYDQYNPSVGVLTISANASTWDVGTYDHASIECSGATAGSGITITMTNPEVGGNYQLRVRQRTSGTANTLSLACSGYTIKTPASGGYAITTNLSGVDLISLAVYSGEIFTVINKAFA